MDGNDSAELLRRRHLKSSLVWRRGRRWLPPNGIAEPSGRGVGRSFSAPHHHDLGQLLRCVDRCFGGPARGLWRSHARVVGAVCFGWRLRGRHRLSGVSSRASRLGSARAHRGCNRAEQHPVEPWPHPGAVGGWLGDLGRRSARRVVVQCSKLPRSSSHGGSFPDASQPEHQAINHGCDTRWTSLCSDQRGGASNGANHDRRNAGCRSLHWIHRADGHQGVQHQTRWHVATRDRSRRRCGHHLYVDGRNV